MCSDYYTHQDTYNQHVPMDTTGNVYVAQMPVTGTSVELFHVDASAMANVVPNRRYSKYLCLLIFPRTKLGDFFS